MATHKRFGSGEPTDQDAQPLLPTRENAEILDVPSVQSESDDDAPEVITASAAEAQARRTKADATEAVQKLAEAGKLKRRDRDAKLKAQSQITKKRARTLKRSENTPRGNWEEVAKKLKVHPEQALADELLNNGKLPDLLPDSVLAIEAPERKPELDLKDFIVTTTARKHKRFAQTEADKVKDRKVGGTTVRVLNNTNISLPPKASNASRRLKEGLLYGTRRGGGGVISQRKKITSATKGIAWK